MNHQKQILLIGATFIAVISILFFNIRAEYSKESKITKKEIIGINEITTIYKLDILLKNIRGLNQLKKEDAHSLKRSLFIHDGDVIKGIKTLKDKKIEQFYNNIINKNLSKMENLNQYTKLLKLLRNKRIDKADSSYLLLESDRELYFLITTTTLDIPYIIENIGKVRALGVRSLNHKKNAKEVSFLLETNLKSFMDKVGDIKYTIYKLENKETNKLNNLLDLIISDFYHIKTIVSNIKNNTTQLDEKDYFLETSKLVNKINSLFATSKEMLMQKLEERRSLLAYKLLLGILFYILFVLITTMSIFLLYKKSYKDDKQAKKKIEHHKFIQTLQEEYIKENDLKDICNTSLNHIVNHFKAINGSLYLYNKQNEKLYLGASYGIKYSNLTQTLNLHENLISENILEKKMNILDITQKISLGNIQITGTKLITIPMLEFEKSIGTIQLLFDEKFKSIDLDFLQSTISLMGSYINKTQKKEELLAYLKLIDKNVLISKTDLDGNITEVSEYFCLLSQYTKEELIGKNHRIFRHEEMKDEIFADIWNTITQGGIWHGELKNRKKDASCYWVDSTISSDCDINGNITGYTAIRVDITDKKRVEKIAITDGLTSLYNRRHFDDIFAQQIEINRRAKGLVAFALIDIDYFKQYNDTYGHQAGDTALKLVAKTLKESLKRPDDYTFRLGGEEFGLVYHVKTKEDALDIAKQAKQNVENLHIEHKKNSASKFVTISSGLYIVQSSDDSTIDDIYKKSDEALYHSKQNGRNLVTVVHS
jgi:diguanylate cyclase (GGDEF)-like protein/PAS domain S-box-containing protein